MTSNLSYKWAILGAGAGIGFGLFAAPLIYILINLFSDGVTLGQIVRTAIGNAFTWGVFGMFAGVFAALINQMLNPPQAED